MKADSTLVSIIVPLRNGERWLRKCLKSIFEQTYRNIEVIVVDDHSNDGGTQLTERMAMTDKRLRLVSLEGTSGCREARYSGLGEARGEAVMFVDADDMLRPRAVEHLVGAMERLGVDMVQMRFLRRIKGLNIRYKEIYDASLSDRAITGSEYDSITSYIGMDSYITPSTWGKIYRSDLLRNAPQSPFSQFWGEDQIINIDYLRVARSVAFIDYVGYIYRWGGESTHFRFSALQDYKNVYKTKHSLGLDKECLDYEMLLLLRYYIRKLYTDLGWTREAAAMYLREELQDPLFAPVLREHTAESLANAEYAAVQRSSVKQIAKRFLL